MAFKREHLLFVYLLRILFAKPEINRPDVFAEPLVSHLTDCQLCITHTIVIKWKEKYDAVVVDCNHSMRLCVDSMKMSLPKIFFLGDSHFSPGPICQNSDVSVTPVTL